ncbi:MAG: selenide, water dikinase SelD, partial [Sphingobacteriales bacterium]
HSIDCPEPVFGLAVNGIVEIPNLKKNSTALPGADLYLTKAIGVGILSTAQKKGLLKPGDAAIALKSMVTLNKAGEIFGKTDGVLALTDVTGFGLLGHLSELCEGSNCAADIEFDKIPQLTGLQEYLDLQCIPGGAVRNFKSYGHKIAAMDDTRRNILCDPQTSGGLLVAVNPDASPAFSNLLRKLGFGAAHCTPFGRLKEAGDGALITVR